MSALIETKTEGAIQNDNIAAVMEILKSCEQPDCPVEHRFSPGIYTRQVFMPADILVVGHKHRTRHQNIVLTGRAIVTIDGVATEIIAPFVFESGEGCRKVLHILEDMYWLTIHANPDNISDVVEMERIIFDLPEEIIASGMTSDDFRMKETREKRALCQESQSPEQ